MKKALLLFLVVFVSAFAFGQKGLYYKAKFLRSKYSETTKTIPIDATTASALSDLYTGSLDDIIAEMNKNVFMANMFEKQSGSGTGAFSFSLSSIAGLDVTNIANGITDLMIERAKEELTVAFFDRFKKFSEQNPEFKLLFPKTTENLTNLLSYSYPQMLPALRDGFLQDIKDITVHLDDVLALPRYQTLLKNFPELRIVIRSLRLIHELETGASNPADVIVEFASFGEWTESNSSRDLKNIGSCVYIAQVFSESIRNDPSQSPGTTIWVPGKELKQLFYDPVLFKLYAGLLVRYFEHVKDANFTMPGGSTVKFSDKLKEQKDHIFLFQNKLKEFFDLADKVDATLADIKEKKASNKNPTDDDYYNYINTAIDVVDYGFSIVQIFHGIPVASSYLSMARKSNDLYKDIYTKHYTQAVNDALDLFKQLDDIISAKIDVATVARAASVTGYTGDGREDVKKLAGGKGSLSSVDEKSIDRIADLQMSSADTAPINDPNVVQLTQHYALKKFLDFIEKLKPFALFMANIADAKDEAAVKAALENVILPVGSSSIKKNTVCNISVQAYLGAFWSTSNGNHSTLSTWDSKFGVTAPIGISWTPGWLSWKKGGSLSIFGSLFDLGAIVDYKLRKDPSVSGGDSVVTKDYSIKLGQLFSPGGYLVYGAPYNLPLSIGFGGQYGPGLSKIDPGNGIAAVNPYWRWSFFLAVDLPFFNLVNRTKK